MVDLDKSINIARKSGKTTLGVNQAKKSARNGDAKAIVISKNALKVHREDVEYYANLSNIPIINYPKTSQDLGVAQIASENQ